MASQAKLKVETEFCRARSLTAAPAFTWIFSELGHMGLYLVDSAPPFVWPKVDGFQWSCSGVSPGAGDRSSGRSRRRRCCGGSPAGSAGLCASTPLLVPESEGPSGPHGHWLHGWPGSPSSLLSWLWWGSAWFSSVSLPPQSGGVSLALVAFISRSGACSLASR